MLEHTPTLETGRLLLRRFAENDADALFVLLSNKEVNTYLPMFPLWKIEEAQAYLKEGDLKRYRESVGYQYAVCLKADSIPIGYVGVEGPDSYDLGYGLRREFWGRGIITEAAKAVVEQAKKDGIPYLTATHDVHNPGSGRVMQKIGMIYQYSYEEQWQPKDIPVTFRMYQLNLDGREDRVYPNYWNRYPVHFVEKVL